MAKKLLKYAVITVICLLVAYNSVYFKKLSDVNAANKAFNAVEYAQGYLDQKLVPSISKTPSTDTLLNLIKTNPSGAFDHFSHALDIGNIRYFMAKGSGTVTGLDESDVYITTPNHQNIRIATEYVFGNALRDAPGIININDFTNSGDLNNVSSELNKIIRTKVLPPFKSTVKKGDEIEYAGAFELNRQHLNTDSVEVIPFYLKIKK
jgi:hypothetical protein